MVERNCPLVHVSVAVTDVGRRHLLLVKEAKPEARGRWNLPGGHMERGEAIVAAAMRELGEETHLDLGLKGLLRVFSGPTAIRFVFLATMDRAQHRPGAGHEIMEVWFAPVEQISSLPHDAMVGSGANIRQVASDLASGRVQLQPLSLFSHRT